jgi:hypothetical protein
MATGLEVEVKIPTPATRPVGLLTQTAQRIPNDQLSVAGVNRIGAGVSFVPWGCDPLTGVAAELCDDQDRPVGSLPEWLTQPSFTVVDGLSCSTLWGVDDMLDERVLSRLRTRVSSVFGRELIDGALSGGISLASQAVVLSATAGSVQQQLYHLEGFLADTLRGEQGMIHVPPEILHLLVNTAGFMITDGVVLTPTGHIVVADAGYSTFIGDISPNGQSAGPGEFWIYASGPVLWAATDPTLVAGRDHTTIDTTRNARERLGELLGLVLFDPCSVAAVKVDLSPAGGVDGGGS